MTADLRKIWEVLTPAERRKAAWMLLLVILMAAAETAGVLSVMPFLSVLGRPGVIRDNPALNAVYTWSDLQDTRRFIVALGLTSIVLVLCASAFKTVTLHLVNRFVHLERHSLSARLLSRYLHQPYEFFLTRNAAVLGKNVLSEVDQLIFESIQPLSQLVAQGMIVLAMAILIFCFDPVTALCIVAILALLYGAIYGLVRKRLGRIGREGQLANAQRYKISTEALAGIKDVQITHSAAAYQQQFEQASRTYSRHVATNETLAQSPLYLVEATGYSGLIIIALVLLVRTNDVAHVLPALGLYGFAAYRMLPAAQIIYRGFAKLKFSSSSLDAIHRDLTLPVVQPDTPAPAPLVPMHEIRLEHIRYAYPSAPDQPVLEDFNLTIQARTSVGIMGRSGAGKSTVMDLLLGLLVPQQGRLTVDGIEVTARNLAAWQRAIGYVPQSIYLADATVAENIAFGVSPQDVDMRAVERSARDAQIHTFIVDELPMGYQTHVGDRGIRLSGGQRQRLGIARALYRNPEILCLDEVTSALDEKTEISLLTTLARLGTEKTIIMITHKDFSKIIPVENIGIKIKNEY
jgi:ABC-type multidrug transport system fused ATPase/permease subunit